MSFPKEIAVNTVARNRRSAFTLVEILVVIAIIAILAALTLAGVMVFLGKGPAVQVQNDMLQLSVALEKFKADKKFYPPSHLKLGSNYTDYTASAADQQSLAVISAMWPQLTPANFVGIQWAGATLPVGGVILEGDQCLVFFLGGIPIGGVPSGFSTNPTNPAAAGGDRLQYMTFPAGRLMLRNGSLFPSFVDGYGTSNKPAKQSPYFYFSAGRSSTFDTTPNSLNLVPYIQQSTPTVTYWNSTSFQIICAGLDGQFGTGVAPGIVWPPAAVPPGADDMVNFTSAKLGNPP